MLNYFSHLSLFLKMKTDQQKERLLLAIDIKRVVNKNIVFPLYLILSQ